MIRLHPVPAAPREIRTTCPYCGVGCGVIVQAEGDRITGVRGDPDHPANLGRLCTKGQSLALSADPAVTAQTRALAPMVRAARGERLQPVAWDAALDLVADRLAATVAGHGADAVGLYLSGQLLTEDYYVFNKLGRALLGTNNVDTNSRLCMSSAVAGYKQSLGADAVPCCYEDLSLARTVFITGSSMAWAHPVLFRRLEAAREVGPAGGARPRWIVVDPRRTETAALADLHLQLLPGTDVVLHHAMLHVMLWEDLVDRGFIDAHTQDFAALRDRVREFTPAHAARVCGLKAQDIVQAARWFAGADDDGRMPAGAPRRPTLSLYCQGLNQSAAGTDKNTTLINLHLATGQIGQPGAGPFSLTGQPNAMGGREVGALAQLLGGHREVANPAHRAELAAFWGVPELPDRPGRSAVELFEAAADGALQALWIVCTNPAHSLPDTALVQRALQRCAFVVVQDALQATATTAFADVLLPASTWGEKQGTVTNSERRISRVRAVVPAPGEARDDWAIAAEVARRLQARGLGRGRLAQAGFDWPDVAAVWREHRDSTAGRDLDITGLDWDALAQPTQWPAPEGDPEARRGGRARLYTDHRFAHADGRARFTAPAWRGPAEACDARHPVALTTGRLRDQWHGMGRTGHVPRLWAHAPEPALGLHPQELARRHWAPGTLVRVHSRRGTLVLPVQPDEGVAPLQAFVAMHWGPEWLAGRNADDPAPAGLNRLMPRARCPQSRQPELKHAAVRLEAADLPWQLTAVAWGEPASIFALRRSLHEHLVGLALPYATVLPFGREPRAGLRLRLAAPRPLPASAWQPLAHALGLQGDGVRRYDDPHAGHHRRVLLAGDGTLQAALYAGPQALPGWIDDLLTARGPAAAFGRALLAGAAVPPQPVAPRSPQVCSCLDVSEARIVQWLDRCALPAGERLHALQADLRCGTQCGSCRPALQALVRRHLTLETTP